LAGSERVNDAVFNQYGTYYDLLYKDKNYAAEADYVASTLRKARPNVRDLLEFGAGTGGHGRLLARQGFNVVGIENSEAMVRFARQDCETKGDFGTFACEIGDIRKFKINIKFDAVISLFHVVSYQTADHDLLKVFANAAHHLKRHGLFFFDVWHGPAVLSQKPAVRVKRVEDENVRLIRLAEPHVDRTAHVVTVTYTLFVESKQSGQLHCFEEQHELRYFFPAEIEMLAKQTGFSIERSEGFLTGAVPSDKTWGVVYLLRKLT
jgi:SAM-dependent methyltransferase